MLLGRRNHGLALTPEGHYTGSDLVERGIVVVVQKDDGTQELLEPADFEQRYGFKNDPNKVHLLQPLPPPPYPLPGQPLGPNALVREPAELADPGAASWTVETRSPRMGVHAVAYRPDGKVAATGGDDGTIRIWDTASGELVRMLVGDPLRSLSWSPDGKVLAAAGAATSYISLWEAGTGRLLRRFTLGRYVAWSPDGRTLAAVEGAELLLWDAAAERLAGSCKLPAQASQAFPGSHPFEWSPDGKTILLCLQDRTVRLWDVASRTETRRLEGQDDSESHAATWSPDGKRIVSTTTGGRAFHIWEAATGKLQGRYPLEGSLVLYPKTAWSPDGKEVAVGHCGLFDPDTGKRLRGLDVGKWLSALAWSRDGKQIATAGDGGLGLHEAATGKRTHILAAQPAQGLMTFLSWSADGRRLTLGWNMAFPLRVVDAATGEGRPSPQAAVCASAWSPDGKALAAFDASEGELRLWDAASNRPGRVLEGRPNPGPVALAWSADSKKVVGGRDQHLWVWSAETGKVLWQTDKVGTVFALAWSPEGGRLATTDWAGQGAVRIWEAGSGKLLLEKPIRSTGLAWSPDGRTLAVAAWDTECSLIDAASGQVRVTLRGGLPRWSADGKTVTTIIYPEGLRAWDSTTGQLLRVAPLSWTCGGPVNLTAPWSPDGRLLARNNHCEIHLSDADGRLLGVLLPFDAYGQLAVAPDGHYRGNGRVERQILMVVQKRDGTSETLTPAEFQEKYGFQNDPEKVRPRTP
jgi:WD40 repeat protein